MSIKTKVQLSTLSYVIAYVKDVAKSAEFYRDILGMKVKVDSPGWVELDTGKTTLALHGIENGSQKAEGIPELVFEVENVYEAYYELKAAGVNFKSAPQQVCDEGDKVGISATFEDLDQNRLSIYTLLPKDKVR
ncbi:MAG: VOC family protein [Candidatus Obscuribacterales bacterium]|nr:VOC family protein [Candidatus Obscuribacterales bacterium]